MSNKTLLMAAVAVVSLTSSLAHAESSAMVGKPLSPDRNAGSKGAIVLASAASSGAAVASDVKNEAATGAALGADAQSGSSAGNSTPDGTKVQEIVVTGSNLARNNNSTPVTTIGAKALDGLGINSNLLEIVRKAVPAIAGRNNAGNSNANNVNQNTAGGSRVQVRNLDTLVLVNGRRLTSSGINAVGGKDFVDVNRIPEAAIARVEVLTDGASAIYGADAVGGVVNIILKSNFSGVEAGGRLGFADGNYQERSGYITAGASKSNAHFMATASWSTTDPLFQNQRPFTKTYKGRLTSFPGVAGGALLNPSLQSPSQTNPTGSSATATSLAALIANGTYLTNSNPTIAPGISSQFDAAPYQTLLLRQDQRAIVASGSVDLLGPKLVMFSDYMYSHTQSFNQTFQAKNNLATVTVPAGAPYNPLSTAFPGVVFGDLTKPLKTYNDTTAQRLVVGFRGAIAGDWKWESGFTYDQSDLQQSLANAVYLPNLSRAIAGGYDASGNAVAGGRYSRVVTGFSEAGNFVIQPALDPFARGGINPASLANLTGTERIRAVSRLASIDAKIVGSLFNLPAGPVGVAIGGAFRRESLRGEADPNGSSTGASARRWGGGSYFDPFHASRTVSAGFGEVSIPITSPEASLPGFYTLNLSAAVRGENYSDAGSAVVPKFGFHWLPFDRQIAFRGGYSQSYNAPTLHDLFGPDTFGISGPAVLANQLNNPKFQGLTYNQDDSSNPNLKASTATDLSLGMVITPNIVRGFSLALDYVDVVEKGYQGSPGDVLNNVDRLGPASAYAKLVAFNNFPGKPGATYVTAPGQLSSYLLSGGNSRNIYTLGNYINLSGIKTQSIDVSAAYDIPYRKFGRFELTTSGTYIFTYQFKAAANQLSYEYAGYASNGGQGVQGTLPKYRLYSTVSWDLHPFGLTLANTFIPPVTDIGAGGIVFYSSPTAVKRHVKSYMTWDLEASYTVPERFSGIKLSVGINNMFNQMPPTASRAFPDNNVDTSTYSPIGRLIFISAHKKF